MSIQQCTYSIKEKYRVIAFFFCSSTQLSWSIGKSEEREQFDERAGGGKNVHRGGRMEAIQASVSFCWIIRGAARGAKNAKKTTTPAEPAARRCERPRLKKRPVCSPQFWKSKSTRALCYIIIVAVTSGDVSGDRWRAVAWWRMRGVYTNWGPEG